jgi:hypothetical protein
MERAHRIAATLLSLSGLALACAEEPPPPDPIAVREPEPLAIGGEQKDRLCSRGRSDVVLDVFCRKDVPEITGILDLRRSLGIGAATKSYEQIFALTGHSTSLVSRVVSAINPRAIFMRRESLDDEMVVLAFARGEQFSELVARDRNTQELQFYLVTFEQDCNAEGCVPGDLLTEAAEVGWKNINVYAEDDLVNTPLDCRVCHQPDGPGSTKFLRMQELQPPWNHWFYGFVPGGKALIRDYLAMKDGELFAGLDAVDVAERSQPGALTSLLFSNNDVPQPNEYVSVVIEKEVIASAAERGGAQPDDNSVPGESATWRDLYDAAKRGDAIAVPYHDVKVTDKDKLAAMTAAYRDYREGRLAREELPDITDVFPDDEELLARMGFATEPGMDGQEVLLQACGQCHNDRLDQTLSRARFNVDLSKMSREQKDRAISRVMLPLDHGGVMPPAAFRHLSDEAKAQLVELLER